MNHENRSLCHTQVWGSNSTPPPQYSTKTHRKSLSTEFHDMGSMGFLWKAVPAKDEFAGKIKYVQRNEEHQVLEFIGNKGGRLGGSVEPPTLDFSPSHDLRVKR